MVKIFRSLKSQIILFFISVSLFSGLALSFTNYWESSKLLRARLDRELENSADMIKGNIEGNLLDAEGMAQMLAEKKEFRQMDRGRIKEISSHFIKFADFFFNIYVYDRKGNLVFAGYFDEREYSIRSENLNDYKNVFTECANQVFADGKPRLSDTFHSKGKRLVMAYVAPIMDGPGGGVKGIISCGIYVFSPKVQKLLRSLTPAYDGFICLVDSKGNVLGKGGSLPGRVTQLEGAGADSGRDGALSTLKLGRETFRFARRKIEGTSLSVIVAVPDSLARSLLMAHVNEMILYNGLSLLVVVLLSTYFSNFIVGPVSQLVEGLQEVARGNYSVKVSIQSSSEMNRAGEAFNEMTEKLEKNNLIEKIWNENWKE